MGDPKKHRKKYKTPIHAWQRSRIDSERILVKEYCLKNKKELWKAESILRGFRNRAKKLITAETEQAKKEEKQLIDRLVKLNLVKEGSKVDNVLSLTLRDILDRRLQTLSVKRGLCRTVKQARQFIVHGHIFVGNQKVTAPSYLVNAKEEINLGFNPNSSFSSVDHPEMVKVQGKKKAEEEILKKLKPKKEEKIKGKKQKTKKKSEEIIKELKEKKVDALDQKKIKSKITAKKILEEVEENGKE